MIDSKIIDKLLLMHELINSLIEKKSLHLVFLESIQLTVKQKLSKIKNSYDFIKYLIDSKLIFEFENTLHMYNFLNFECCLRTFDSFYDIIFNFNKFNEFSEIKYTRDDLEYLDISLQSNKNINKIGIKNLLKIFKKFNKHQFRKKKLIYKQLKI